MHGGFAGVAAIAAPELPAAMRKVRDIVRHAGGERPRGLPNFRR